MTDSSKRRPSASSPEVRKRMQSTGRRDTPSELEIRTQLANMGLSFVVDYPPIRGARRRADVVFIEARVAVYMDGCFWHGCPEHGTWPKRNAEWWREKIERNRLRDADTNRMLAEAGWGVVRIWEHECVDDAVRRILQELDHRQDHAGLV
jgi:DNA mismatch endonuclease (patch repair protein)